MRVKTGNTTKNRHKKILKATKGYRMTKNRLYKVAHEAYLHAGQYSYKDRRKKLGAMRRLWIIRLSAAARQNGMTYKDLMHQLKRNDILLNRKMLSEIAYHTPGAFTKIVESFSK